MNRKQYLLLVVLTVMAGLIGGVVSNQVFMARAAIAQEAQEHEKVITAEQLNIVDTNGKLVMKLGVDATSKGIYIYDTSAAVCMKLAVDTEFQEPSISLSKTSDSKSLELAFCNLSIKDGNEALVSLGIAKAQKAGIMSVKAPNSKKSAQMTVGRYGGSFVVYGGIDRYGIASMSVTENGGSIYVKAPNSTKAAKMDVDEYGGYFSVYGGVDDISRAGIGVNKYGHGAMGTWDKYGYKVR